MHNHRHCCISLGQFYPFEGGAREHRGIFSVLPICLNNGTMGWRSLTGLHHAAAHKPLPVAATPRLAVGLQNNLGCCTLDLREESTRAVLGCYWQSMAEGEHLCIELVRGLRV